MKWLKHILVVVALMVAAMPCCHADHHDVHDHDAHAATEICSSHACACHSCDATPCSDDLEMPQEQITATTSIAAPKSSVLLFVFSETKPLPMRKPSTVNGIIASLQTVQLLI